MIMLHANLTRLLRKFLSGALLMVLVACAANPTLTAGRGAPSDKLASLEIGASGETEVRAALGMPRGHGFLRHVADDRAQRSIWFYELVQFKDDQIGLKILLVFFAEGKYDGHLWFAAQELIRMGEP